MFTIKPLCEDHLDYLIEHFEGGASTFVHYMQECVRGQRAIFVATDKNNNVMGYITLIWDSQYPMFKKTGIPEIVDLIVHESHRRKKIGLALLSSAENEAQKQKKQKIGLGVGLSSDYGPAQRLYISQGYVPDGTGVWNSGVETKSGDTILLSEHTTLMLVKDL